MCTVAKLLIFSSAAVALDLSEDDRKLICDDSHTPFPQHRQEAIRWLHMPTTGASFADTVWHYGCNIDANVSVVDLDTRFEVNLNDKYPIADWCPKLVDHTPSTHKPIGKKEWFSHRGHFVTMVREPSSRIMSAFYHGNHHCISDCNPENSKTHFECHVVHNSIRSQSQRCVQLHGSHCPADYAAALPAQGCQTKMILGYPCSAKVNLTEAQISQAVHRVQSGFSFVGLVEEWDLSLCMFHRILGGDFYPVERAHVRPTGVFQVPEDCPKHDNKRVRDDLDLPVYQAAQEFFDKKVRQVLRELKGETSHHREPEEAAVNLRTTNDGSLQSVRRHA